MNTLQTFITLLATSFALPLLAFLAIVLRRSIITGILKKITLFVSLLGLSLVSIDEYIHHRSEFGPYELYVATLVSFVTFFVLSKNNHHHRHKNEDNSVKGIILAESFHSLFDGLAIGSTFLVTPLLGAGAALGIFVHEIPKMIATLALIRSLGYSMKKTILYGVLAQIGAPITAVLVYLFGIRLSSQFHIADIAVIASLATIVMYILYLELLHHYIKRKNTSHHNH